MLGVRAEVTRTLASPNEYVFQAVWTRFSPESTIVNSGRSSSRRAGPGSERRLTATRGNAVRLRPSVHATWRATATSSGMSIVEILALIRERGRIEQAARVCRIEQGRDRATPQAGRMTTALVTGANQGIGLA